MKCSLSLVVFAALALEGTVLAQPPAGAPGGPGGRGGRGGGGPNFPQQTRKLAPPDVLARGKAVYGVNCTACHGADLRGGDQGGPSLLRSLAALSDQGGEVISPIIHGSRADRGMPSFNLSDSDSVAVAEYIHSVLAQVGRQARPPGAMDPSSINILAGNAPAGAAYFKANCAACHSVEGDLKGIAARFEDARDLQNAWWSGGGGGGFGGGRGGGGGKPSTVTVTLPDGRRLEGTLIHSDDFIVSFTTPDGTRHSFTRSGDVPQVTIHDPYESHKKLALALTDNDMHDVTAWLATIR